MKAIILKQTGGVENLIKADLPRPTIKDNEVLVQVKYISINPVDAVLRSDEPFLKAVLGLKPGEQPIILGWDISGVVTEAGDAVTKFKKGDEVFGMVNFPGHGKAYAEYVAAPEAHLALKPANISHAEAAAATLTALTAWQSLVTYGKIQAGDKVLIHSAAGGTGHYAVQLAKHFGAYVIGTGAPENRDFILSLGADEAIDYKSQPFEDVINDADLIVDGVTFTTEHIYRSLKALRNGGRLISLVAHFDDDFNKALSVKNIRSHRQEVESNGVQMESIAALLASGDLKSYVSQIYSFDDMAKAHLQIETGKTRGKIVVEV